MDNDHPGRRALAELDEILRDRPEVDGEAFTAATKAMAAFRDQMIDAQRGRGPDPAARKRLEHANAVISVLLAGHFPLGSVPWPEVEAARSWLQDLLEQEKV